MPDRYKTDDFGLNLFLLTAPNPENFGYITRMSSKTSFQKYLLGYGWTKVGDMHQSLGYAHAGSSPNTSQYFLAKFYLIGFQIKRFSVVDGVFIVPRLILKSIFPLILSIWIFVKQLIILLKPFFGMIGRSTPFQFPVSL